MTEKILLVDDEEGIRKVLAISLEDRGYEVFTAEDGKSALGIFKEHTPPIVLTDIKMPGMDGIELLKEIMSIGPDTEVIMITGHGDMELAVQSLKFQAADFITKPIHEDALEIALKRASERIAMRKQLRDYTENLERLVEEKTGQLVEAERLSAMGQTVSGLAHAIKNVAGALTGGSFVLEKGFELGDESYLRAGWEMVRSNVSRVKELSLDLLNFTKERKPDYRLCDPNAPLRDVFQLLDRDARKKDVLLALDLDESLPMAWFDPDSIHRCLMNLVTNAVDACLDLDCSAEAGRVNLRTVKMTGWAVQYEVVDNGCGMDDETKANVFNRFFSTKGSKGTGLGLMITQKIVREHGGTMEFNTEKGKGTRFVIRLPNRNMDSERGGV